MTRAGYLSRIGFGCSIIRYQQRYLPIWRRFKKDLSFLLELRNLEAEIYHAHYAIADSTILAVVSGRLPIVISTMGADILLEEQGDPTVYMKRLLPRLLKCAEAVTVKSEFNRQAVLNLGIDENKITLISWGVDTSVFYPKAPFSPPDKKLVGKKILLQPRGLPEVYNNEMLLDSIARLVKNGKKDFVVWLPKAADSIDVSDFMEKVIEKGLNDYVVVTSSLDARGMNEAYNLAHCTITIAASDGLPMTIPESLATGTPVIVGELPHFTNALENEGILWTAIDSEALSNKIAEALDYNPSAEQKANIIAKVKCDFNLDKDLLKLESLFRKAKNSVGQNHRFQRLCILTLLIANNFTRSIAKLIGRKKMNRFYVQKR